MNQISYENTFNNYFKSVLLLKIQKFITSERMLYDINETFMTLMNVCDRKVHKPTVFPHITVNCKTLNDIICYTYAIL